MTQLVVSLRSSWPMSTNENPYIVIFATLAGTSCSLGPVAVVPQAPGMFDPCAGVLLFLYMVTSPSFQQPFRLI